MRDVVEKMTNKDVHVWVAEGHLLVAGNVDDLQRQYIKKHRDELKSILVVDVEARLSELAVGLPVDSDWLRDCFCYPDDLTLISLGEFLTGDLEPYRDEIRQFLALHGVNRYQNHQP
jgi:hypothetical protein